METTQTSDALLLSPEQLDVVNHRDGHLQVVACAGSGKRWWSAVNNQGDFGTWDFLVCRQVNELRTVLEKIAMRVVAQAQAA